ncbi:MAG: hypothetical protein AB1629_07585 [Candidatus Omnitrophota bacterium]
MLKTKFLWIVIFVSTFFVFLNIYSHCLAQVQEELTITTYYPAPFGVYRNLQLFPLVPPPPLCDDTRRGLMYYSDAQNNIFVCRGTALGWQEAGGGFWTQSGQDLYPDDLGWQIGIGTNTPTDKLDVKGTAKIFNPNALFENSNIRFDYNANGSPYINLRTHINDTELRAIAYDDIFGNLIYSRNPNLGTGMGLGIAGGDPMLALPRLVIPSDNIFLGYNLHPGDGTVIATPDASGNLFVRGDVGIGTKNPSKKLEVIGDIKASGTICTNTDCLGPSGPGDSVMELRGIVGHGPDPNACPGGWIEANYTNSGFIGEVNVRTCYRTDKICQVMDLTGIVGHGPDPNACPGGWIEANYTNSGFIGEVNVRTCYRCN